ncbi:MAG: hypothetical protein ABI203_01910 [Mucilaginibacter sp.]
MLIKFKVGLGVVVLLLLNIVTVHAQTLPCNGDDPDASCPLDTWVMVLVIAASLFAAFRLYRLKNVAQPR